MPTRYWLVGGRERGAVSRLESAGGVRRAEAESTRDALAAAHDRYAAERDAALPADHDGPAPDGGVGGTRQGVKCLHAHYAWYLAGGDDPVGRWVDEQLRGCAVRPRPVTCASPPSTAAPTRPACWWPSDGDGADAARAPHAHHPPRPGRRPHRRARRPRPSSAPSTCSATTAAVIDELGADRRARDRHLGRPRRRQPRRLLRRRRGRSSASRPSCSPATRRGGSRSSAPPPTSTRRPARSWSSTSAAGRPSSRSARRAVEGVLLARHRLRPPHRAVPARRPARARGAEPAPSRWSHDPPRRRRPRELPGSLDARDAGGAGRHRHHGGGRRASGWPPTTATRPPLPADPRRRRGRVPHPRHRAPRRTASTTPASSPGGSTSSSPAAASW